MKRRDGRFMSGYPDSSKLEAMIKEEASKLNIAPYPLNEIKSKVKGYYDSYTSYPSVWKIWYKSYIQACIVWALKYIYKENPIENQMYLKLDRCKKINAVSEADVAENDRISDIIEMLSTQGIFPKDAKNFYTLNEVMQWLERRKCQVLADAILALKDYCDAEGIRSVLESADVNGIKERDRVLLQNPNDTNHSIESVKLMSDAFITRLRLMTVYVKRVAITNYKGQRFCDRFWIRSTGSDPHCDGEHALFLVDKVSLDIAFVYKPHDLSGDNMVVGKTGILQKLNEDFTSKMVLSGTLIENEDAFATIEIDVDNHVEEFVTKKQRMTSDEAKKYFFRAGLLKAITDAMAVIDLHRDNIMPTQNNAPLIIDAEVDFFRYASSGLEDDALTLDKQENRFANSSFEVEGKRSGDLFKSENSEYYKVYETGRKFMCKLMFDDKDYFSNMYEQYLQNVNRVRMVPIKTQDLNQGLMEYIIGNKENYFLKLINRIKKILIGDNGTSDFVFNKKNNLKIKFYDDKLNEAIKQALDAATIIALYADIDGRVYLNHTKVGDIVSIDSERAVSKEKIIEVMKESFLKVVEGYDKCSIAK